MFVARYDYDAFGNAITFTASTHPVNGDNTLVLYRGEPQDPATGNPLMEIREDVTASGSDAPWRRGDCSGMSVCIRAERAIVKTARLGCSKPAATQSDDETAERVHESGRCCSSPQQGRALCGLSKMLSCRDDSARS